MVQIRILKVLGWIVVPYIMVIARWGRLTFVAKTIGIVWSFAVIMSMTHGAFLPTPASSGVSPTLSSTSSIETKPVSSTHKKPSPQKSAKVKFETELQNIKTHKVKLSAKQQLQFEKEYLQYDKQGLLKLEPSVLDAGFAGDLFVQTDKGGTQKYNSIGYGATYTQANGIYWVVLVTMNNAGMNPMIVDDSMFTLTSSAGRNYAPDISAEMSLVNEKPLITDTLNPVEDVTEYLVFDMPIGMKPLNATLRIQNGLNQVELKIS